MSAITVIYADRPTPVDAISESDSLWLDTADLARVSGWKLKPEGACKDDICIPMPPAREADFVRADGPGFNLAAFARSLGQPALYDDNHGVWFFGESADTRRATLASLEAPDFELPDIDGTMHRLSDYRGRKVLLSAWASW